MVRAAALSAVATKKKPRGELGASALLSTPRLLNRLKQVVKIDGLIVVVDVSVLLRWIVVFIAINETNPTKYVIIVFVKNGAKDCSVG